MKFDDSRVNNIIPTILNLKRSTPIVIGLEKEKAIQILKEAGYTTRIIVENGKSFIVTMDLREDRMNLSIEDGKVVSVKVG